VFNVVGTTLNTRCFDSRKLDVNKHACGGGVGGSRMVVVAAK